MPEHAVTGMQWVHMSIVIVVTLIVWAIVIFIFLPRLEKRVEQRKKMKDIRRIPGPEERMTIEALNRVIEKIGSPSDEPPTDP